MNQPRTDAAAQEQGPQPRSAATIVMVREGDDGLEVFMVRRHDRSDVLGGMYVFPGGKVDAADADAGVLSRLDLPARTLHARLGEAQLDERAGAALFVAAIREAREECHVLFAQGEGGAAWTQGDAGGADFNAMLDRLDLRLMASALHPWSRWITPVNSISLPGRRFDTRFFAALLPPGQTASHDRHEAVDSLWIAPREALARYWSGQILLAPPQIMSLAHLGRFAHAQAFIADVAARKPHLVQPLVFDLDGGRALAYPGDAMHCEPARIMPGPLRLIARSERFEPPDGRFEAFWD